MSRRKYLVFTAIFGRYDVLREIPQEALEPDLFDYVCFTDLDLESSSFKIRKILPDRAPHLANRYYKILIDDLTKGKYQGSIYLDGNVTVKSKLGGLIDPDFDLIVHDHPRRCVYEEAKVVLKKKKDSRANVKSWIKYLKREGFPKNQGLYWNGVLIRNHSEAMNHLCRSWWRLIVEYSYRDQLTLPYLLQRSSIKVQCIERKLDAHGVFDSEKFFYDGTHKPL